MHIIFLKQWVANTISGLWRFVFIIFMGLFLLGSNVDAQVSITIGSGGKVVVSTGKIKISGDWTNNGAFTPGSGTVVFDGATPQTITNANGETFNKFTVDKSGGDLILNDDVAVTDTLTLTNEAVSTGANTLTLGEGAEGTLSRTSGTIIGNFERHIATTTGTRLFPVGTASSYRPLTIDYSVAPTSAGTVTVSHTNPGGNFANLSPTLDDAGYTVERRSTMLWTMSASSIAGGTYDLAIDAMGQAGINDPANLRVVHSTDGLNFNLVGTHSNGTDTTAKRTGIDGNTFGQFYIGGNISDNPLFPQLPPSITATPSPIDFGNVNVGLATPLTVEIGNIGHANLSVIDITSTLGGILTISETMFSVVPSERHDVILTLTPSVAEDINGTLTIESNDPNSPTLEIPILAVTKFHVGDVSGDGSVTAFDAALILQFVVGLIDTFPVEALIFNAPADSEPRNYAVSVPEISLKAGERAFVPVEINDATGLVAGGLILKYDPSVVKAVNVVFPARQSYGEANTDLNGEVRFAFVNLNGIAKADKLLFIEFEALPNAEGKTSLLILSDVQLSNSLSIQKGNGRLTVLPSRFYLYQNYPNPFNPDTWIPYDLAADAEVTITIYDASGIAVHTLSLGQQPAGAYRTKDQSAYWNGRGVNGESVASGVYFYHLTAGDFYAAKKMLILK